MLAEAALALMASRLLTFFPMRIQARALGHANCETPQSLCSEQIKVALGVGSAVQRAAQVVPFKAVCIEQTLAASMILRVRGVPATAYFGVHRDPDQRLSDPRGFNAHAWLRAGALVIIGGPDVSDYIPLSYFA